MIRLAVLFLAALGFAKHSFVQSEDRKPTISKAPLTPEQIAVYQTFLKSYAKGSDRVIYVADTTDWLDPSDVKQDADCSRSFGHLEFDSTQSGPTVHRLEPGLTVVGHISFVNSVLQSEKVRQNDPSKTMQEGKPVDRAVSDAFASGLLTLSEIAFNKGHDKAVMSYSFFCGKLCGNGAIVMFKRTGRNWTVTKKSCGEWVS